VIRCFAPMIGLLAALAPAMAHAQTNLDQGKSASQIFASACAECHKAAHGLAHGKNSAALADFLREHYTTNSQQAAALAAYVLGGSGVAPIGGVPQGRGQKPKTEQANVSTEEPKPSKPHARASAKPEEAKPDNEKLRRSTRETAKPKEQASPSETPSIVAPENGQPTHRPATAARGHLLREPKAPLPALKPVPEQVVAPAPAAEPTPTETPSQVASPGSAPSSAGPADSASGEPGGEAPVPRDNIPD
jgi:hypothetical protein